MLVSKATSMHKHTREQRWLTFTESGDKRSSSDAVDDETGDESDDLVGRPIRFFVVIIDVDDAMWLLLLLVPLLPEWCDDGIGDVIVIGGIL